MSLPEERTLPDELIPKTAALLARGGRTAALATIPVVLPGILLGLLADSIAAGRSSTDPHVAFFVGASSGVVGVVALHAIAVAAFVLALQKQPAVRESYRRAFTGRISFLGPALGLVGSPIMVALGLYTVLARGRGLEAILIGGGAFVLGTALYSLALVAVTETILPPHPIRVRWERPWFLEAVVGFLTPAAAVAIGGPSFTNQLGLRAALPGPVVVVVWIVAVWASVLVSSAAAVAFASRGSRPPG